MLKVAVWFPSPTGESAEYLADISALEAAGTDTIWVECASLDSWLALGALAATTHRARLGCILAAGAVPAADQLTKVVAAAQKLSRGRIVLAVPPVHLAIIKSAEAKVFSLGEARGNAVDGVILKLESAGDIPSGSDARSDALIEVWADIEMPPDRESWSATISAYAAAGATGVIVPWNARVLDLLRNPEPDDRTDLLISTG